MVTRFAQTLNFLKIEPKNWQELADAAKLIKEFYGSAIKLASTDAHKVFQSFQSEPSPQKLAQIMQIGDSMILTEIFNEANKVLLGSEVQLRKNKTTNANEEFTDKHILAANIVLAFEQGQIVDAFMDAATSLTFSRLANRSEIKYQQSVHNEENRILKAAEVMQTAGITADIMLEVLKEKVGIVPEAIQKTIKTAFNGTGIKLG